MLYLSALTAFFAVHIIPFKAGWRNSLTEKLGESKYKLLYRLVIIFIIVLGIYGWSSFPNIYFYEPPLLLKQLHLLIMMPTVFLWVVAEIPNNTKRYIRHPMLTGMKLWALGHLLANGDLRSMILFISFMTFSVIAVILANKRGPKAEFEAVHWRYDLVTVALSAVIYVLLVAFHGNLFGMPVYQYFQLL